jgi:uncharacterized membrane protein (UPF0127 family)
MYALKNRATGDVIAGSVVHPKGWYRRTLGLLSRTSLGQDEGLWLDRCWGIHTVGMKFPIDVLFLDEELRILSIRPNVRAGRLAVSQTDAHHVIELSAGTCERLDLLRGDRMELTESRASRDVS